jgi:hypothetical protein
VYAVDAVGVHIIRKAAGAADARNEHDVFFRHANIGQCFLHLGQDGVIATARAPTDSLVRYKIFAVEGYRDAHNFFSCKEIIG